MRAKRGIFLLWRRPMKCAGPTIVLRRWRETAPDRVVFNVVGDIPELQLGADPVVVRLGLPEGLASAAENCICLASARALDSVGDAREWLVRQAQHVDVIRHDHPRMQFVQVPGSMAEQEGFRDRIGNGGVGQPCRARPGLIQLSVHHDELLNGRLWCRPMACTKAAPGQRAVQPKGQEDVGVVRLPVRKAAPIEVTHIELVCWRCVSSQQNSQCRAWPCTTRGVIRSLIRGPWLPRAGRGGPASASRCRRPDCRQCSASSWLP